MTVKCLPARSQFAKDVNVWLCDADEDRMSIPWVGCAWCWPLLCFAVLLFCFLCPLSLSLFALWPPLCFPLVIPSSRTLWSLFSDLSFLSPSPLWEPSVTPLIRAKTPPVFLVFSPLLRLHFPFPLISSSFIPLCSPFWAQFAFSPTCSFIHVGFWFASCFLRVLPLPLPSVLSWCR